MKECKSKNLIVNILTLKGLKGGGSNDPLRIFLDNSKKGGDFSIFYLSITYNVGHIKNFLNTSLYFGGEDPFGLKIKLFIFS